MQWSWARVDARDAAREVSQGDTFREGNIYVTFPFLFHLESEERRSHLIPAQLRHPVMLIWFEHKLQGTNDKAGRVGI